MVLGVGDIQFIPLQRDPLRPIELGGGIVAVGGSDLAGADGVEQTAVESGDHYAIMVAIGNEQPAARLVGDDFARESKRRLTRAEPFEIEP